MVSPRKNHIDTGRSAKSFVEDLFQDDATALPLRRLLSIARQSGVAEPSSCAVTLLLLSTGRVVRHNVQKIMRPLGLSEARFLSLVTLYTLDPMPSCPANLAYHADITRTAMTDTLDQMEKQGWIQRQRLAADRRTIHVHLTEKGREIAAGAIRHFLSAAAAVASSLKPSQHKTFGYVCRKLRQRAEEIATGY